MNKRLRTPAKLVATLGLVCVLPGCAMLGYSDQFNCSDHGQDNAGCQSALQAYKASNGPMGIDWSTDDPSDKAHKNDKSDKDKMASTAALVPGHWLSPTTRRVRPIRTPAQVMRVYIAPWVGQNGNLTLPTYVYTQVKARRWSLGTPVDLDAHPHFYPLQVHHGPKGTEHPASSRRLPLNGQKRPSLSKATPQGEPR